MSVFDLEAKSFGLALNVNLFHSVSKYCSLTTLDATVWTLPLNTDTLVHHVNLLLFIFIHRITVASKT